MQQELTDTKRFFADNHIIFSDFWLESCLKWFHEQIEPRPYTQKDLRTQVYEQWLDLDLRDVEVPQLPPNINAAKKVVLNKSVTLQVMSVIDISQSKYRQLQKIKNSAGITHDFDEERDTTNLITAKRMLQMTLTDGMQEILGVEYNPIPQLDVNLIPGTKIRINAPVTIRRGQMMLEPHNVKLLGGEVEEISISHSLENVLARSLGLQENPQPFIEQSDAVNQNNENSFRDEGAEDAILAGAMLEIEEQERERYDEEIEMLLETEREINGDSNPSLQNNHPDLDSSLDTECELFNSLEMDKHLEQIEEQHHLSQQLTIGAVLRNLTENRYGRYKIYARFKSVVRKMNIEDGKWNIQIEITDGEDNMVTFLHDSILEEIIGLTVDEVTGLKERIGAKDPEAVATMMKGLERLKEGLVKLDGSMDIECRKDESPMIIKLY